MSAASSPAYGQTGRNSRTAAARCSRVRRPSRCRADSLDDLAARPVTKSVEELEREFARQVRRFIDLAIAEGHSLQEAKAMARDVVARAVRQSFKVVSTDD
jgi:hypothetical protein